MSGWLAFVSPEDHPTARPPVPDYTLLHLIGRGSYGDVWIARGVTGMLRAVKVVWRDRFSDIEPYEREFRGLSDFIRLTQGEARLVGVTKTEPLRELVWESRKDPDHERQKIYNRAEDPHIARG